MDEKEIGSSEKDLTEIKELYAEELNLLKRISNYGKDFPKENQERIQKVTMLLLYRIYSNLFSALLLTSAAYKKRKASLFQLSIGVVLRCAITDCIFALYILSVGTKDQKDYLISLGGMEKVVTRLYHYYKYFSQYEHFSEEGQGDVLVSLEEDGNDNIHLPSAIRVLSDGVEEIVKLCLRESAGNEG